MITILCFRMHGLTNGLHGAGIVYFTYWPTNAFEGQGMILSAGDGRGTHEYRVGPHYYEAQRINSVLRIFGGRLLHAQSTGELPWPQPFFAMVSNCLGMLRTPNTLPNL